MTCIQKRKLADHVIEEIRRRIESGEFKGGDKLPNQNEFAAQLGVSRTSLREAINRLTLLGAIEQRPGYGTVIKAPAAVLYIDHLAQPMINDEKATIELLEFRRVIELGAVELAVPKAREDQIAEMGLVLDEMALAHADNRVSDFMKNDLTFHILICESSGNRILLHHFITIQGQLEQFMHEKSYVLPLLRDPSLNFHSDIYKAFQNRNRRAAMMYMDEHLRSIQTALGDYYKNRCKKAAKADERLVQTAAATAGAKRRHSAWSA
ncbi:MAG: FadR/GntR family transcriptional regulator [Syntrophobacteraceae bacterium]|jgi:GntR family transcriptional repressor for pyruvate dehydrogenase complex